MGREASPAMPRRQSKIRQTRVAHRCLPPSHGIDLA